MILKFYEKIIDNDLKVKMCVENKKKGLFGISFITCFSNFILFTRDMTSSDFVTFILITENDEEEYKLHHLCNEYLIDNTTSDIIKTINSNKDSTKSSEEIRKLTQEISIKFDNDYLTSKLNISKSFISNKGICGIFYYSHIPLN